MYLHEYQQIYISTHNSNINSFLFMIFIHVYFKDVLITESTTLLDFSSLVVMTVVIRVPVTMDMSLVHLTTAVSSYWFKIKHVIIFL